MEYKLVTVTFVVSQTSALEEITKAVNDSIAQGWEPLGGLTVVRDGCLVQAMLKRR